MTKDAPAVSLFAKYLVLALLVSISRAGDRTVDADHK